MSLVVVNWKFKDKPLLPLNKEKFLKSVSFKNIMSRRYRIHLSRLFVD